MTDTIVIAAISKPQSLKFNGTSFVEVRRALTEVFGKFPIRLDGAHHVGILTGMAAVAGEGRAPYDLLIAAVRQFDAIEVNEQ